VEVLLFASLQLAVVVFLIAFFFSSRRRHTRSKRDWSSDVCSSDLVGQALAFSRRKTGNVAIAVAGEGAANQGAFHESLNLAALWKLPVVFVIEDNEWGISVPRSASTSVPSNAVRAAAYGMPGTQVEDNSVEA